MIRLEVGWRFIPVIGELNSGAHLNICDWNTNNLAIVVNILLRKRYASSEVSIFIRSPRMLYSRYIFISIKFHQICLLR